MIEFMWGLMKLSGVVILLALAMALVSVTLERAVRKVGDRRASWRRLKTVASTIRERAASREIHAYVGVDRRWWTGEWPEGPVWIRVQDIHAKEPHHYIYRHPLITGDVTKRSGRWCGWIDGAGTTVYRGRDLDAAMYHMEEGYRYLNGGDLQGQRSPYGRPAE